MTGPNWDEPINTEDDTCREFTVPALQRAG